MMLLSFLFALGEKCVFSLPSVILWFIVRNIYLVFIPSSWHRARKTLGISCVESLRGVFCYVNEGFWKTPKDGVWSPGKSTND